MADKFTSKNGSTNQRKGQSERKIQARTKLKTYEQKTARNTPKRRGL